MKIQESTFGKPVVTRLPRIFKSV